MNCTSRIRGIGWAVAALLWAAPQVTLGDERDSNADAAVAVVSESTGALIRVPINAAGEEDTNAAELRVYADTSSLDAAQLPQAWSAAAPMDSATAAPATSASDSSTWGWGRWGGWGWRNPYYYYNSYRPYFNYYGNYYNYYGNYYGSYPYYYNNYYPYGGYYGHRYYYYPRYW